MTRKLSAADVGTGSGCIAISLATHLPGLKMTAIDRSGAALEVARLNALRHNLAENIHFVQADLLSPFSRQPTFRLVCANLPYIPQDTLPGLPVYGHEPSMALNGGAGGLEKIERLLRQARPRLAPGGLLLLEIEASQGRVVPALAQQVFPSASVHLLRDLSGRDRLVSIQLSE